MEKTSIEEPWDSRCLHTCARTHVHAHVCAHTDACTFMHVCTHAALAHMHTRRPTRTPTHTHALHLVRAPGGVLHCSPARPCGIGPPGSCPPGGPSPPPPACSWVPATPPPEGLASAHARPPRPPPAGCASPTPLRSLAPSGPLPCQPLLTPPRPSPRAQPVTVPAPSLAAHAVSVGLSLVPGSWGAKKRVNFAHLVPGRSRPQHTQGPVTAGDWPKAARDRRGHTASPAARGHSVPGRDPLRTVSSLNFRRGNFKRSGRGNSVINLYRHLDLITIAMRLYLLQVLLASAAAA